MYDNPFSFLFLALSGDSSDEEEEEDEEEDDDGEGGGDDDFSCVQFGSRYQQSGVFPCMCFRCSGTNVRRRCLGLCFESRQGSVT